MSDPHNNAPDEGWKEIPGSSAPHHAAPGVGAVNFEEAPTEEKVYGRREPTPPGMISLRVGAVGLIAMLALFVFSDVRAVDTPWQRAFPFVYALSAIPVFGMLWGFIGLVKRTPGDISRAATGLVLSLAALGVAAVMLTTAPPSHDTPTAAVTDRTKLAPKDLTTWREKKLHLEKQ
jgi:hypothetical protein